MGIIGRVWYEGGGGQFKILLEDNDGFFYVGGDRATPVKILTPGIDQPTFFYGITSLGPGLNDWVVSGSTEFNGDGTAQILFVQGDGTVFTQPVDEVTWQGRTFWYSSGGLIVTIARNAPPASATLWQYTWHTPTASGESTAPYVNSAFSELGYVLPEVLSAGRIRVGFPELQAASSPNPDYSYGIVRGDFPTSGPTTNPYIVSAAGDFALLDRDLNAELSTGDLVGLTLYTSDGDFFFSPLGTPGSTAVSVSAYTIDPVTGATTDDGAFSVNYQVPSGDWRWILQASYHP